MMYAVALASFLTGLVFGLFLHYIIEYKPLLDLHMERQADSFDMLYRMKRQGFVPQFDIEQARAPDLTDGVVEY